MMRFSIRRLLGVAVGLPIAMVVVAAFSRLLAALGDAVGGRALERVLLALVIVWILTLIGLLLRVAVRVQRIERQGRDERQ